jgi:hypothetical protein
VAGWAFVPSPKANAVPRNINATVPLPKINVFTGSSLPSSHSDVLGYRG